MLYLFSALFFSTLIFVSFKLFERFSISILLTITISYFLSTLLGYVMNPFGFESINFTSESWLGMAIATGVSFIFTFFVFGLSTQKVGVSLTVVASKMSVVISVAVGLILLSEPSSWFKIVGILLALVAFWLTNKRDGNFSFNKKYFLLPMLIFLGSGINDSLMKLSGEYYPQRNADNYLVMTFFTAFLIGISILIFQCIRGKCKVRARDFIAGILLSIFNWFSTIFFIKGLFVLPISVFIPVFNASIVVLAAGIGNLVFKEKLSKLNIIGILIAVVAIFIIAFA